MIAYIVTSAADLRWVVDKAMETRVIPALHRHRLTLFDELAHAIQNADSWSEPLVSALQVTVHPEFLLQDIMAGTVRRTWYQGLPGWDVVSMPYTPDECHLKVINLTALTVGTALRTACDRPGAGHDAALAPPTRTSSTEPVALAESTEQPPTKRARICV